MTTETNDAPAPVAGEDTAAVLAAATGEKTYLPSQGDEPAPEAKTDEPGDDAPATEGEAAEATEGQPKAKLTASERVQQAVARQREAERDRDFYKEQALRAPTPQPAQVAQPDTPQGDGKPDPTAYENGVYDPQYVEDLTDWKVGRALQGHDQQRRQQEQVRANLDSFETRRTALFPEGNSPGLDAFLKIPTLPVSVFEIVGASDVGPKIAEHLGDNPAELARLERLSPILQARELTRIEARLAEPAKPIPKTATDAPEPAPQARGASGQFKVAADTDDFAAFEKQYRIGG